MTQLVNLLLNNLCAIEDIVYSAAFVWMLSIYQLYTLRSNVFLSVCVSSFIFCLGDLFTDVNGKLKSPPMIAFLLISPFMSINILLIL